ncbi:hypothetical protein O1611_g2182 [Lasiodiplodia mahajangana]|uniref:Uncharacterized protein n=1 Tax=Lasiodiplodia mahajangana TaxID=1108764 RepID=A0ACC2JVY8_9PEZI|nr:hypothetical protein O1611_g2182 [Lasiodiplodia mahajangana]
MGAAPKCNIPSVQSENKSAILALAQPTAKFGCTCEYTESAAKRIAICIRRSLLGSPIDVLDLHSRLEAIPTLLSHSLDVLDGLLGHSTDVPIANALATQQLENLRRQAAAYSRTASCLHQRAQASAQLLSDTLSLREQTIAKNQANSTSSLSKSTYWITIMGLLYLPTSLVAILVACKEGNSAGACYDETPGSISTSACMVFSAKKQIAHSDLERAT